MKVVFTALAAAAALGLAACVNVTTGHASAPSSASRSATSPASAPTASAQQSPVTPSAPASTSTQPSAPSASPANVPNVTDPWAVVSAHYGDIESGDYAQAWALISSGAVTGQTYQQFVNGFACTGAQQLTELSESGDKSHSTLQRPTHAPELFSTSPGQTPSRTAGSSRRTSPRPAESQARMAGQARVSQTAGWPGLSNSRSVNRPGLAR